MRTLYVKETTIEEINEKWGFPLAHSERNPQFIQCTKDGEVNWEKNSVYSEQEIKDHPNAHIYSETD